MWPFDANNQQMYQNYANAWDQGTYNQLPEQEVLQNYQQFLQNAPPSMVQQVHEQYFQQAPVEQSGGLIQGVLSGLTQRGMNPQQFGVPYTDPYSMSPQMAAQLATYGQQQHPGLLQEVMANPAAKMAMAGIASYAAKQILGNRGSFMGSGLNF
jgi:hypothetical protein